MYINRSAGLIFGFIFGYALFLSQNGYAIEISLSDAPENAGVIVPSHVVSLPDGSESDTIIYAGTQVLNLGAFNIVINAGSALSANPAALAAFNRAAMQWESRISDPVSVNISANLANLGSSTTLGQSSTVMYQSGYSTVRNKMVSDAAAETDDLIVSYLPVASQFTAAVPSGFSLNANMMGTKANFKALGIMGPDTSTDATITFNSEFNFDYDNSNGVTSGTWDFETVAAHELGHALGFISSVDQIDQALHDNTTISVAPTPLDLFRFDNGGPNDPSTTAQFTTFERSLVPNNDEITDQIFAWGDLSAAEFRMSTGAYSGDGRQASHWKDNGLTGLLIGIMDPTLASGQIIPISEADFRALDLIGYNISQVPEPSALILLGIGLVGFLAYARRRQS